MSARRLPIKELTRLAHKVGYKPGKLAKLLALPLRALQRKFKQELHASPGRYLRLVRCREVKRLVSRGMRTKEISKRLDYTDEAHLCHDLKKNLGVTARSLRSRK